MDDQQTTPTVERRQPMPITLEESWIKFFTKAGVTAMIAIWLVYIMSDELRRTTQDTNRMVREHVVVAAPVAPMINSLVNVMIQNCVNTATSRDQRDACFSAASSGLSNPRGQQ
jgi:hypothetical protein